MAEALTWTIEQRVLPAEVAGRARGELSGADTGLARLEVAEVVSGRGPKRRTAPDVPGRPAPGPAGTPQGARDRWPVRSCAGRRAVSAVARVPCRLGARSTLPSENRLPPGGLGPWTTGI
ncbi:hypothetical protein GCM10018793_57970 [Streptomyces sulfonofaciens]|uniref:Uncharacterized protein n=1 Tax=Streptomyces sulfonofaciens TaxID=68272 RepID=A0A919L8A9_9ACTN|nr:hypothetical protein GCM10018793_57970 [Streptomyces sulfonofaciens]